MMDQGEIVRWSLTTLGVTGAVLNARQRRASFCWWIVANVGWIAVNVNRGQWAETALFSVYLLLACYGLARWSAPACPGMLQKAESACSLLPSLAQRGNPMVTGGHHKSRVLPGTSSRTGGSTPIVVSGENPLRGGIVESSDQPWLDCNDMGVGPW